jgi:hypothetical protein
MAELVALVYESGHCSFGNGDRIATNVRESSQN